MFMITHEDKELVAGEELDHEYINSIKFEKYEKMLCRGCCTSSCYIEAEEEVINFKHKVANLQIQKLRSMVIQKHCSPECYDQDYHGVVKTMASVDIE